MKKRIVTPILILGMVGLGMSNVYGNPLELVYDGNKHIYDLAPITLYIDEVAVATQDMPPVQIEQTTLVPIREVFEPMGAHLEWKPEEKKVYIAYEDRMMILEMNNPDIWLNGETLTLEVPAKTINNKIMVPVRFISEQLGFDVEWDGVKREININSPVKQVPEAPEVPEVEEESKEGTVVDLSKMNLSYESSERKLFIHLKKQLNFSDITIKNDYVRKKIVIDLGDNYNEMFSEVEGIVNDEVIDYIAVEKGQTTQIILHMKSIYEHEIEMKGEEVQIKFIKPKDKYDKILFLDAGHGGTAPGSIANGLVEKEVNLKQTLAVKALIEQNTDIKVYLTRTDDSTISVEERPFIANDIEADLFVSIHNNSFGNVEVNGTEVHYYLDETNNKNKEVATLFQEKLIMYCGLKDRGTKPRTDLWVLKKTEMPAVLIEAGYLSNPQDAYWLGDEDFNARYAYAVYEAIVEVFEQ